MIAPDVPIVGNSGAGRFANGVEPVAPGGWNGRMGVLGDGDNMLMGKNNPKDKLI